MDKKETIKRKNCERIPLRLIKGGCQGNGKPFKVRPGGVCDKKVVRFENYAIDVYNRLKERVERFRTIYDGDATSLHNADGTRIERKWRAFHVHHELFMLVYGLDVDNSILDEFEKVKGKIQEAEKEFGLQFGNYKGW